MVFHAYFLPCCNECIIWEIGDNVNIMGEHADTQVKVCGYLVTELAFHES
jgi:hypothetical protein